MPELCGSTTDSAAATATAASNALPPAAMASKPASVASLCALAIAAWPDLSAAAAVAIHAQATMNTAIVVLLFTFESRQ
jgi:hypothetical protein